MKNLTIEIDERQEQFVLTLCNGQSMRFESRVGLLRVVDLQTASMLTEAMVLNRERKAPEIYK